MVLARREDDCRRSKERTRAGEPRRPSLRIGVAASLNRRIRKIPVRRWIFPLVAAGLAWRVSLLGQRGPDAQPAGGDTVVVQWNDALLQAVRETIPGPTVVARAIAVVNTSMFDAWSAYDAAAVPTVVQRGWRRPAAEASDAAKTEAVSFAAYRALVDLFPGKQSLFDTLLSQLGYAATDDSDDPATPAGVGNGAAAAVLAFRHHDGSNQLGDLHPGAYSDYTGYMAVNTPTMVVDPNRWQPLSVANSQGQIQTQVYTTPQWGLVFPFALPSGSALRPGPPARYPSQDYVDQADEIIV